MPLFERVLGYKAVYREGFLTGKYLDETFLFQSITAASVGVGAIVFLVTLVVRIGTQRAANTSGPVG